LTARHLLSMIDVITNPTEINVATVKLIQPRITMKCIIESFVNDEIRICFFIRVFKMEMVRPSNTYEYRLSEYSNIGSK